MIERSRLLHFKEEILNFHKKKKKLSETILDPNFNHVKNAIFSNFYGSPTVHFFPKKNSIARNINQYPTFKIAIF